MSYLGNTPVTQSFISGTDYFNGTGAQTAFTLSRAVASINDIQVTVNNVVQQPNSGYTISGTTLTFDQAPSAGTNNVYVRYLSTTTQAITPSQNTVSWNTLDSNVRGDLGISFKNRIINGNMAIAQRSTASVSVLTSAQYVSVDRWGVYNTQSNRCTVQQNAGSVTPPSGFTNYIGITSSSSYSSLAGDIFVLYQAIEGFNTADLSFGTANAQSVTLSFWVRSSLTGTFGGSLQSASNARAYPFTYTISSANTWEQKFITITGDTSGTMNTTNGVGLTVNFNLGTGTTSSGTAGAWASTGFFSATGATSVVGTNGATFYVTGVMLEVGTQATTFTTAGGSYGAELALCQRYYIRYMLNTSFPFVGRTLSDNRVQLNLPLRYQMRATPSLVSSDITAINNMYFGTSRVSPNGTQTYSLSGHESVDVGGILISGGGTYTDGQIATAQIAGSIAYSAEL